jgi:ribonuclease HI
MEMQAAIAALKYLQASRQQEPITLYTDSEYLINCVTKWVKSWKKKGWKKADGKPVLNQDLLEILDELNSRQVRWQHVRGHAGNIGNERCDQIARAYANGISPSLQQLQDINTQVSSAITEQAVTDISDLESNSPLIYENTQPSIFDANTTMIDSPTPAASAANENIPREMRVAQLRNLVETLRIADEIADKGYLITSSELADLMDVHASAVTSRGDEWRWRNWVVSRVRREGNQILWELERADRVNLDEGMENG